MRFLLLFLFSFNLYAQPIEMVVTASPGGPDDTVSRRVAEQIEKNSNIQIVIVNRPGAAHVIGYNYIQNSSKPTIVMSTSQIMDHPLFSELNDLHTAGYFYNTLFVSKKLGINTFKELVDMSQKKQIAFGHGGIGTFSHMAMKNVCEKTLKCLDVPFKSGAEGMLSLMSGNIDAYSIVSYGSKQYLENDKLLAIHNIRTERNRSWFKLFGKNLSKDNEETIKNILSKQPDNFYKEMGLEK